MMWAQLHLALEHITSAGMAKPADTHVGRLSQALFCALAAAAALSPALLRAAGRQLGRAHIGAAERDGRRCSGDAARMLRREGPLERPLLCAARAVSRRAGGGPAREIHLPATFLGVPGPRRQVRPRLL